jgi:hypothetical protein
LETSVGCLQLKAFYYQNKPFTIMRNRKDLSLRKTHKIIVLIALLIFPLSSQLLAAPFVTVSKNGAELLLSVSLIESAIVSPSLETNFTDPGVWLVLPIIFSFGAFLFLLFQFLKQIIQDHKFVE